jgi:single-stranded-DNA-specific exonuclease
LTLPPRWRLAAGDAGAATRLAAALGLSPLVARILVNRGLADPDRAARFLDPRLADLTPPATMLGMARAADRIAAALHAGEPILTFGDYDVDGVTASAVLVLGLRAMGGRVVPFLPNRARDGYGLSPAALERGLAEADARFPGWPGGTRLVVTADCGIAAHEALAWAAARGLEVIVTDHHRPPAGDPPPALAVVNPRQAACPFPYKDLAAVGLAFLLVAAVRARLRERGAPAGGALPNLRQYLDIVALGTLADVAPLGGDNRVLAVTGLAVLREGRRPGLRALCATAGLDETGLADVDARCVAFRLVPRLNAAGRVGDPGAALALLLAENAAEAAGLAADLDAMNRDRQGLEAAALEPARAAAAAQAGAPAIVAAGPWHRGVVGIVAARLAEESGRPAAVIALDPAPGGDGVLRGRGSIRAGGGVDVYAALARCADLLDAWGGHAQAAGFTVVADRVEALRARFAAAAAEQQAGAAGSRPVIDAAVALPELDPPFWRDVARLPPYGPGNPEPLLAARLTIAGQRVVGGGRHLRLELGGDAPAGLCGIGFRMGARYPLSAGSVIALFAPELERWQGRDRPQLALRDLEPEEMAKTG